MNSDPEQKNPTPIISVGLPVYNGGDLLKVIISSILSQTYTDFELIISDNASEDQTKEICKEYIKNDPRIRYHRNNENIGDGRNFGRALSLAKGKYFIWAAHDDEWLPNHLETLTPALDKNDDVVLSVSGWESFDADGKKIESHSKLPPQSIVGSSKRSTFRRYLTAPYWDVQKACFAYGLMRRNVIQALPVADMLADRSAIGRDVLFILAVLSKGSLAYTPTVTWRYRHVKPRKRRTMQKKAYDLLRFPTEALFGKRKQAWARITAFHRQVDTLITKEFGGNLLLRTANLYNTIRLCALFKH